MLQGWLDEPGSKNWHGLWIEDWAAAGAKGEWLKLNAGGLRVLLLICLGWWVPSWKLVDAANVLGRIVILVAM